jgi:membrane fusion protein, adhesin transport system
MTENIHTHTKYGLIKTPDYAYRLMRWLAWLIIILPLLMLFLPWLQNIQGTGTLTAFQPTDRIQTINAPIDGLVSKWHIVEGSKVKAGDLLLEIRDVDPNFSNRLQEQLDNNRVKLKAKQDELASYELQVQNYQTVRDSRVTAANFKRDMARQKVVSAMQSIAVAEATFEASKFQVKRMQRLLQDGLVSQRDVELAERDNTIASRNLASSKAILDAAKAEENSALAEVSQYAADAQGSIQAAKAQISKLRSEYADIANTINTAKTNVARQDSRKILAPADGVVFRVPVNSPSQLVSKGQALMTLVPENHSRAVILQVEGLNAPLIVPGSQVRLQFEGWPVVQVSGWPRVSYGTFAGKVSFVDPADSGNGFFRVMVIPDETEQKWPSSRFLRQGSAVKGWILLNEVSIGYEVWRILNGFPPNLVAASKPAGEIRNAASTQ